MSIANIEDELTYSGYKGYNLDRFPFNSLKNIMEISDIISSNKDFYSFADKYYTFDKMSIDEALKISKGIFEEYFNTHNILLCDEDILDKTIEALPDDTNPYDFYEAVNGLLTSIDPFDIPFKYDDKHDFDSRITMPLRLYPGHYTEPNRKIYFSHITSGYIVNLFTSCYINHEVMHTQLESVIGYTDDYLNREVLSIFVEKLSALKVDPTGELLKMVERIRFDDLVKQYNYYLLNKDSVPAKDMLVKLTYIKSTLVAEKLFDMYMQERKEKNKDKYIDDIQNIMDGRVKLDEVLIKRGITPSKCQDVLYLKRQI